MTKKYSLFTTLVLALTALLGFSSLGLALTDDAGGMTHMEWLNISNLSNPATFLRGVTGVVAASDGYFVATVQNETTSKNDYYYLDPSNRDNGWIKEATDFIPPSNTIAPPRVSSMPFAFGANGFSTDAIALPDHGVFTLNYAIQGHPFYEAAVYGGNIIKYTAATSDVPAFYHIHTWPLNDQIPGTPIDSSDARFPVFETPSVFYSFPGDRTDSTQYGRIFYIASALESKSNQYHSLVISYGLVPLTPTLSAFMVDLVADPIGQPGQVIVGIAGSEQGYVAVGSDGITYFAQP